MSSERMIWVASWEHGHTTDMYAATTREALGAVLAAACMDEWPKKLRKPRGDWKRVETYFRWHLDYGDETLAVDQVVLEHDLAGAAE